MPYIEKTKPLNKPMYRNGISFTTVYPLILTLQIHTAALPAYGSRGFPDAAFLIGDGNYFWHGHFPLFDFMYKLCISLKNAVQAIPPLWAVETASPAIFITFGTTGLKRSDLGFCRMNSSSACCSPSENTFRLRTSPAGIKNGVTLPLKRGSVTPLVRYNFS